MPRLTTPAVAAAAAVLVCVCVTAATEPPTPVPPTPTPAPPTLVPTTAPLPTGVDDVVGLATFNGDVTAFEALQSDPAALWRAVNDDFQRLFAHRLRPNDTASLDGFVQLTALRLGGFVVPPPQTPTDSPAVASSQRRLLAATEMIAELRFLLAVLNETDSRFVALQVAGTLQWARSSGPEDAVLQWANETLALYTAVAPAGAHPLGYKNGVVPLLTTTPRPTPVPPPTLAPTPVPPPPPTPQPPTPAPPTLTPIVPHPPPTPIPIIMWHTPSPGRVATPVPRQTLPPPPDESARHEAELKKLRNTLIGVGVAVVLAFAIGITAFVAYRYWRSRKRRQQAWKQADERRRLRAAAHRVDNPAAAAPAQRAARARAGMGDDDDAAGATAMATATQPRRRAPTAAAAVAPPATSMGAEEAVVSYDEAGPVNYTPNVKPTAAEDSDDGAVY